MANVTNPNDDFKIKLKEKEDYDFKNKRGTYSKTSSPISAQERKIGIKDDDFSLNNLSDQDRIKKKLKTEESEEIKKEENTDKVVDFKPRVYNLVSASSIKRKLGHIPRVILDVLTKKENGTEMEYDKSKMPTFKDLLSKKLDDILYFKPLKPSLQEETDGIIEFRVIRNDNQPLSMILLTGLKNIFQKQLPKMPKEYISRLVYDRNHTSMAIVVKNTLRVLGGITYRLFDHRQFAEIVFCAIASSEQVKGYGSHLMNHLKAHILKDTNAKHFLTYADNYAIGYFKKQGFTREITLPEPIWMGYIKDYEGGTLMQCSMVPKIDYLKGNIILALQKKIVNEKIQTMSSSHIKYPGLTKFAEGAEYVDPMDVPGLKESGYDPSKERPRPPPRSKLQNQMLKLISEMCAHNSSWPFLEPVDVESVPDYLSLIKHPMDLSTLEKNVEANMYKTKESFLQDAYLIFENARKYNAPSTPYFKSADKLEEFLTKKVDAWKD